MESAKGKSKLIIIIAVAAVAVIGIAVAVVLALTGEKSYRSVSVLDFFGDVKITRKSDEFEAYADMALKSGDDIVVGEFSELDMQLDEDKFVYLEQNSHMWLEAKGDSDNSNTIIHMEGGKSLHDIKNKLSEGSSYQVETPNATMMIRGTIPYVEVKFTEDGNPFTDFKTFNGFVDVYPKNEKGETVFEEPIKVESGYAVSLGGDPDENGQVLMTPVVREITTEEIAQMSSGSVEVLINNSESGREINIGSDATSSEVLSVIKEEVIVREETEKAIYEIEKKVEAGEITKEEAEKSIETIQVEKEEKLAELDVKLETAVIEQARKIEEAKKEEAAVKATAEEPKADDKAKEAKVEVKPVETKPEDTKPVTEVKPADTKPADAKPADTKQTTLVPVVQEPAKQPVVQATQTDNSSSSSSSDSGSSSSSSSDSSSSGSSSSSSTQEVTPTPTATPTPTPDPGPFTVTFVYDQTTFATQTVEKGASWTVPVLMPTASGNWDSQPAAVTGNMTVKWVPSAE